VPPSSHLTSHAPTQSNSQLPNSLVTVISEPDQCRLLSFHVPNLMSLIHWLGHTKESVPTWGNYIHFVTRPVFMVRICLHLTFCWLPVTAYSIYSWLPSIHTGPVSLRPRCIMAERPQTHIPIYIYIYPPYWRLFLHLQCAMPWLPLPSFMVFASSF
jgi:hypothetical protein